MPRLRRLTAREVLRILRGFGFEVAGMRGSHAKLVRVLTSGERQTLTVPVHPQLPNRDGSGDLSAGVPLHLSLRSAAEVLFRLTGPAGAPPVLTECTKSRRI